MQTFEAVFKAAEELDARRQKQIANQAGTINRLLLDGATYEGEMQLLHEQLAAAQAELDELRRGK